MTSTVEQFVKFCENPPAPGPPHADWNQLCELLVHRAGDFPRRGAYNTAYDAAINSGALDSSPGTAKPGEFHYWSSAFSGETFSAPRPGHVAMQGPDGKLRMASSTLAPVFVGAISFAEFHRKKSATLTYLGHSPRHGRFTLDIAPSIPDPAPPELESEMRFRTKNFYVTDLFTTLTKVTAAEARALDGAAQGVAFAPVTSDEAKLIFELVRVNRIKHIRDDAQARGTDPSRELMTSVNSYFEVLASAEKGFTRTQVDKIKNKH